MTPQAVRRTRLAAGGLGVFVLLLAVAAAVAVVVMDASFVVLRPGTVHSDLGAGSLALTVPVEGRDIRPGDVVSVHDTDGEQFASTVVTATVRGDETTLVVRGDRRPHVVRTAQRVSGSLPYAGYAVSVAASPPGVVLLGALLVVLGLLAPGPQELPGGRHRQRRRLASLTSLRSSVRSSLD